MIPDRPPLRPLPLALLWLLALPAWSGAVQQGDPEADLRRLVERPSSASVELVRRVAETGTDAAGRALVEHYGELAALGARLAALDALVALGDRPDLGAEALRVVREAAGGASDPEEREAALRALAAGGGPGRAALAELIEAPVDDTVRERAMELHVLGATPADDALYRRLWRGERRAAPGPAAEPGRGRKLSAEDLEGAQPRERLLPSVMRAAFLAVADRLSDEDLQRGLGHWSASVRRNALRVLLERGHERGLEWARAVFENRGEFPDNRVLAAEALLASDAEEWLEVVVEEGGRRDARPSLRRGLAELVARYGNEELFGDLAKQLTRGGDEETIFRVLALVDHRDDRYEGKLEKLVRDKDAEIRRAAIEVLGRRGDPAAVEVLEKAFERSDDPVERTELLRALSTLRADDREWDAALLEMVDAESRSLRNAALRVAAERGVAGLFERLVAALEHPDWSTRRIAIGALAERGDAAAVGALVARVEHEQGRLLEELTDHLWRLTGRPFGDNARAWTSWWAAEGAGFEPIGKVELAKLEAERERRRLEASTRSPSFFGLRVTSGAVTFVIDVSGSMEEATRTAYEGRFGPPRFEVAIVELRRAIERLEPDDRFNVLAFSNDVYPWDERLRAATEEGCQEALEFIDGLRATGGTNLHAALEEAFADPEMDTLVVLSDGQPTGGAIVDPELLRRAVADWNRDRGVRIHTVQLGAELQILEWLAEDSGGRALRIP